MGAKRTFDLITSFVGLVILSPLFVVIAFAIKSDTSGPVFYRGVRTGLSGIPFRIMKFRTMVPDAESLGGRVTERDDTRVTRVGRVLRKHKLDELPQLVNVITGDMSIVGPRPEVAEYTALYTEEERLVLSVRPGITDYASIEFVQLGEAVGSDTQDGAFEDRIRKVLEVKNALRVKYVREQTLIGDIKLILLTLRKLITDR